MLESQLTPERGLTMPESSVQQLIERARKTGTTGRYLVFARKNERSRAAVASLQGVSGWAVPSAASAAAPAGPHPGSQVFPSLGVAVVTAEQLHQVKASVASVSGADVIIREERLVQACPLNMPSNPPSGPGDSGSHGKPSAPGQFNVPGMPGGPKLPGSFGVPGGIGGLGGRCGIGVPGFPSQAIPMVPVMPGGIPLEYWLGYRDGVTDIVGRLTGMQGGFGPVTFVPTASARGGIPTASADSAEATWGLQAILAANSRFSGRNVRVAILDTGIDLTHPDFQGRLSQNQVADFTGQGVQDNFGHGTHCAGIACGPQAPANGGPRYGVAFGADLFIGKVLDNCGSGIEGSILQGIQWAINQGCRVVSMSFEAPGQDPAYNGVGDNALANNTLLIAAAGNDSDPNHTGQRISPPAPTGAPANSNSIISVGAVDQSLAVASFSNAPVNIVGPGVDILSSYSQTADSSQCPLPGPSAAPYLKLSGTSMATPFVAGIAALIAESHPEYDAADIARALFLLAQPLQAPSTDVGVGLVRPPRNDEGM